MTLLKSDGTLPERVYKMEIISYPNEGIGQSIKDGWNFGIGFGLAMTIAMPIILVSLGLIIGMVVLVFGALL